MEDKQREEDEEDDAWWFAYWIYPGYGRDDYDDEDGPLSAFDIVMIVIFVIGIMQRLG